MSLRFPTLKNPQTKKDERQNSATLMSSCIRIWTAVCSAFTYVYFYYPSYLSIFIRPSEIQKYLVRDKKIAKRNKQVRDYNKSESKQRQIFDQAS